jgi:Sodium/hydrogen exchanger family
MTIAAAGPGAAQVFIELGAVALVLAALAALAGRLGITAIPFYLVGGLAVGEGGIAPLDVSEEFISVVAEIGVLLLLLTLGLEYSADELRYGLRTGLRPGLLDAAANFAPGFAAGLVLGWEIPAAVLLGGATWVSSSGIAAKVLADLDRLGNRETPTILNLLVIEDLAMAAFLPIAGALVGGKELAGTVLTVAVALTAATAILTVALRYGDRLSGLLASGSDEALLLAVFGLTLLVGGLAQQLDVSAAIGAFLVGLALSGPVQHRAGALLEPLRDLFAAVLFSSSLPDRPRRPPRRARPRRRARRCRHRHQAGRGMGRGSPGRRRTARPAPGSGNVGRPRRVLDRHREPRRHPRRRRRPRRPRRRLRARHRDHRTTRRPVRRYHPSPRTPRPHRRTAVANQTRQVAAGNGRTAAALPEPGPAPGRGHG